MVARAGGGVDGVVEGFGRQAAGDGVAVVDRVVFIPAVGDDGELVGAGFANGLQDVLGVEGPAWMLADFDARWVDPVLRADMLTVARALETEPSMVGVSAHLLGVGHNAS